MIGLSHSLSLFSPLSPISPLSLFFFVPLDLSLSLPVCVCLPLFTRMYIYNHAFRSVYTSTCLRTPGLVYTEEVLMN